MSSLSIISIFWGTITIDSRATRIEKVPGPQLQKASHRHQAYTASLETAFSGKSDFLFFTAEFQSHLLPHQTYPPPATDLKKQYGCVHKYKDNTAEPQKAPLIFSPSPAFHLLFTPVFDGSLPRLRTWPWHEASDTKSMTQHEKQ